MLSSYVLDIFTQCSHQQRHQETKQLEVVHFQGYTERHNLTSRLVRKKTQLGEQTQLSCMQMNSDKVEQWPIRKRDLVFLYSFAVKIFPKV